MVFWLSVLAAMGFVLSQSIAQIERVRVLSGKSVVPEEIRHLPGVQAREMLLPEASVDSMWWVMHTEAFLEGRAQQGRVRWTDRDNAPAGREVHWSSSLVWLMALLAWLIHLASGLDTIACVQDAALLFGPLTLLVFIGLFAMMVAHRWGYLAGGFGALALATNGSLLAFSKAGEADHHGLVIGLALACILALTIGGAGWLAKPEAAGLRWVDRLTPQRRGARQWFVFSGWLAAAGLWISASTLLPVLFGIAFGVALLALLRRWRSKTEEAAAVVWEPGVWRWWGTSGALGSLFFYVLEYAPSHFGWRLEVNHPLYALAFWGAGEWLAILTAWGAGRKSTSRLEWVRLGLAALALSALPAAIFVGGSECFVVQDAFLWRLHHEYILEFRSLAKYLAASSWGQFFGTVSFWPLLLIPLVWGLLRWRVKPQVEAVLLIPLGAVLPLCLLACLEERWLWVTGALWLGVPLGLLAVWRAGALPWPRPLIACAAGVYLAGLAAVPVLMPPQGQAQDKSVVSLDEAYAMTAREVAWLVRQTAGERPINVLSGPSSTSKLVFYGDMKGIGTLYWENAAGLKTAAKIFAAETEDAVLDLFREHQITHLVLFSWDHFGEAYTRLHRDLAADASVQEPYLNACVSKRNLPIWLRPLHYKMMPEMTKLGLWVDIFEFRPEQRPAESYYHLGKYLTAGGLYEEAIQAYAESWKRDSELPGVEHELGVAMALAGRHTEARALAARLPESDRFPIESALARRFTAEGRHEEAVAAWRRALQLKPEDETANLELAWLLATSEDADVRNGPEALALMTRILDGAPAKSLRQMDVLAAANAENGRFEEALALIEKALALARNGAALSAVREIEQRKTHYASDQPFRTPLKMGM